MTAKLEQLAARLAELSRANVPNIPAIAFVTAKILSECGFAFPQGVGLELARLSVTALMGDAEGRVAKRAKPEIEFPDVPILTYRKDQP